jgi:hypothetical protein
MFEYGMISVGKLDEILDEKGMTAYPVSYKCLDAKTYEVVMTVTRIDRPILSDHIGWLVPIVGAFEPSRIVSLKTGWQLKKILLAVTEVQTAKPKFRTIDLSSGTSVYESYKDDYPRLIGCAQHIPLDDEEKFLCDIHGIKYA